MSLVPGIRWALRAVVRHGRTVRHRRKAARRRLHLHNSFFLFLAVCLVGAALLVAPPVYGGDSAGESVKKVYSLDHLPVLRTGVRTHQISSFDRTGGNDDGNRLYAYLAYHRDERSFTIFEDHGPGALTRFWMTGWRNPGELRFFVDADNPNHEAAFTAPVTEIFAGNHPRFPAALVGTEEVSSGGFYSYVPIRYAESLRIETAAVSRYIQLQYEDYADEAVAEAVAERRTPFDTPPSERPTRTRRYAVRSISPGESWSGDPVRTSGLGTAVTLEIPAAAAESQTYQEAPLRSLTVEIYTDGREKPDISAPAALFFGGAVTAEPIDSRVISVQRTGNTVVMTNRLPIPFAESVRLRLVNTGTRTFPSAADVGEGANDGHRALAVSFSFVEDETVPHLLENRRIGRLRAISRRVASLTEGDDFTLFDEAGGGTLAGVVLAASSTDPDNRRILEGDDRVFLDGARSPQVHGTGLEDFFNGGWYYNLGTFSQPMHGNPSHIVDGAGDHTTQFRFMAPDPIRFYTEARLAFEHGPKNDMPGSMESTVFWYSASGPMARLTDRVDPGSATSEADHEYDATGATATTTAAPYIGVAQSMALQDDGYGVEGSTAFTVSIDPANAGVLLRRRADFSAANQRVAVSVDGEPVGIWNTPGFSKETRFIDTEFQLPRRVTAGKSQVRIRLRPASDGDAWNEYRYWIYSYLTQGEAIK